MKMEGLTYRNLSIVPGIAAARRNADGVAPAGI